MNSTCEESFWRLIGLTGQAMRSYADQRLKAYALTVEQLQVLKQTDVDVGQPQNKLSLLTGKSPANMTRILDRLEKKNRIVRKRNPDDRRSILVFLTQDGEMLRNDVINLFEGLRSELVDGIEVEKQLVAIEVLRAIRQNIKRMSED
ncbi:MAG: MarR family winged helix-turn-helix transcriptional regulator [Desulforhopalus sp.]